jgi:hypothetical protein
LACGINGQLLQFVVQYPEVVARDRDKGLRGSVLYRSTKLARSVDDPLRQLRASHPTEFSNRHQRSQQSQQRVARVDASLVKDNV